MEMEKILDAEFEKKHIPPFFKKMVGSLTTAFKSRDGERDWDSFQNLLSGSMVSSCNPEDRNGFLTFLHDTISSLGLKNVRVFSKVVVQHRTPGKLSTVKIAADIVLASETACDLDPFHVKALISTRKVSSPDEVDVECLRAAIVMEYVAAVSGREPDIPCLIMSEKDAWLIGAKGTYRPLRSGQISLLKSPARSAFGEVILSPILAGVDASRSLRRIDFANQQYEVHETFGSVEIDPDFKVLYYNVSPMGGDRDDFSLMAAPEGLMYEDLQGAKRQGISSTKFYARTEMALEFSIIPLLSSIKGLNLLPMHPSSNRRQIMYTQPATPLGSLLRIVPKGTLFPVRHFIMALDQLRVLHRAGFLHGHAVVESVFVSDDFTEVFWMHWAHLRRIRCKHSPDVLFSFYHPEALITGKRRRALPQDELEMFLYSFTSLFFNPLAGGPKHSLEQMFAPGPFLAAREDLFRDGFLMAKNFWIF